ncbi:hypothetical protein RRG37_03535 [Mycoplasmopsis felis]|uniref:TMEM164 family acyltransferase n=1 Tax=Mycoplasmopsis felis TaxID=33923 RepID=UPI002AFFC5D7|nr:hypothetical protein [Mycoplasmopsis felis]WQQ06404.1 YwaF family protein [Mycoplasmopsis felis]
MGFFTWRFNQISFDDSKILFNVILSIILLSVVVLWVYKSKITLFFANKDKKYLFAKLYLDQVLQIVGVITLLLNFSRSIWLFTTDYPWKWELIPIHLCRLSMTIMGFLFIFKKSHWIKYFSIISIIGAIAALLFANLGYVKELVEQDRNYNNLTPGTIRYEKAGVDVGYDTIIFWDFLIAHWYVLIVPVFIHIIKPEQTKLTIKTLLIGMLLALSTTILIFFINWTVFGITKAITNNNKKISIAWNSNWFYLGQTGIKTLGPLSRWPWSVFGFTLVFIILIFVFYGLYILLRCIDIQINKYYLPNKIIFKKPSLIK